VHVDYFAEHEVRIHESDTTTYRNDPKTIAVHHVIGLDAYTKLEVYPAVFERQQLWIKSESRWARTPVEAMAYVLLHELGHLEADLVNGFNKVRDPSVKFAPIDDTEDAAWQYAQSVMRCTGE
jgi:hypothetical protein